MNVLRQQNQIGSFVMVSLVKHLCFFFFFPLWNFQKEKSISLRL